MQNKLCPRPGHTALQESLAKEPYVIPTWEVVYEKNRWQLGSLWIYPIRKMQQYEVLMANIY